jgi:hypothetical protein
MKKLNFKNNSYSILLAMLMGLNISCTEDFLETEPSTSIPTEKVFETIGTAEAALIGAYDQLSAYTTEGLYMPLMADIMGEDVMINAVDNWNWFVVVYQLNVLPNYSYVTYPWTQGYKVIYDANNIIEGAKTIPDASEEQINNLEGQAKVIRAFMMLKLAQMYGDAYSANPNALSIMNVNRVLDVEDEDFPRATNTEVYGQIEGDLLSGIELLAENSDNGFFDKRAAQAILARTYLDMEEFAKARDMARLAYEGLDLMSVNDMFTGFSYRNSETIYTVAYTADDNNVYLSIPSFYWPESGYSSIRANDEFVNKFASGDVRSQFLLSYPDIDPNRDLVLKFAHYQQVGNAERISIRASEMYLIEAECEAELGNYTIAQEALLKIQERSIAGASKSDATGQELIDEVLLERRKELFGEGFRWNDIKRRSLDLVREGNHWAKFNFGASDADYYRLTFPIPQSEIDANDRISQSEQNVGY